MVIQRKCVIAAVAIRDRFDKTRLTTNGIHGRTIGTAVTHLNAQVHGMVDTA